MLVIGTYRDVELDVNRPFEKTLDRLTRQRLADRVSLRRLSEGSVAQLLANLAGKEPPYIPYIETLEYAVRAVPEDIFRESLGESASEVARIMPELRQMFPDIPPEFFQPRRSP